MVHGEQVFIHNYNNIEKMLKPLGGGGTRAGCVSDYINKNKITADCIVMFTDGYLEGNVVWNVSSPTLWLVTKRNDFTPPAGGRKVIVRKD
jgi:predicted metal-dependent peptidase